MAKDVKKKEKWKYNNEEYIREYVRNNYFRVGIRVRNDDVDIIKKLESVENKNSYILDLIRKDIKK